MVIQRKKGGKRTTQVRFPPIYRYSEWYGTLGTDRQPLDI